MLKIPYNRQDTDFTCGPAALSMALGAQGVRVSESRLRKLMGTRRDTGTTRKAMLQAARHFGCRAEARYGRGLEEIVKAVRNGRSVIVLYTEPDEDIPHYAVFRGFSGGKIRLSDPWNGPRFSLSRRDFLRRWHDDTPWKRWALAVGPKSGKR